MINPLDQSAFQLNKHTETTNIEGFLQNTPIINYGRIIKVIDIQTVVVESVVQTSLSRETSTITLLNLSSALLEINDYPSLGDTVLLFFLQRYDPRMFVHETVHNEKAVGYNCFSGVGILMSAAKRISETVISFTKGSANIESRAKWKSMFNNSMAITFCRAIADSEDEQLISMCFGEGRPFIQQFLSRVEKEHGFWHDHEGNLTELDASVKERYSKYAPIYKNIQGSQTYSIGTDDNGEPTDAPIKYKLNEKSDITINSLSGKSETYEKSVLLKSKDTINIEAGKGKVTIQNNVEDLCTLLVDFIQTVCDAVTLGSPTTQKMNPATQGALQALIIRAETLLGKE
jgi:hypothetical protein